MNVSGAELIRKAMEHASFEAKCVFNEEAAVFFPVSRQHRDMNLFGLNYRDDHEGNALAAMVKPGLIEIRFHKSFSDAKVKAIWKQVVATGDAGFMQGWKVTYQGREV